jgi:hypothetical protein
MKLKTWVKRWAVEREESLSGLVNFFHTERPRATDGVAQMRYSEFVQMFGIALEPERVYSLRIKATAKARS